MAKYRVPCVFMVCSEVVVEAESSEEAVQIAEQDVPLPPRDQWEYLEGSFDASEFENQGPELYVE